MSAICIYAAFWDGRMATIPALPLPVLKTNLSAPALSDDCGERPFKISFLKNPAIFTSVIFRRLFMKIMLKIEVLEKSVGNFGHFQIKRAYRFFCKSLIFKACLGGIEPPTCGLEIRCSIQLS